MTPLLIPRRIDLIRMFPNSVGAEIGVCKGHFSIQILNSGRIRKLFCVDAWEGQTPGEPEMTPEMHEANLAEAKYHLRGHIPGGRIEIVRGRSVPVAQTWLENKRPLLDWVYIDAAHDYESVQQDLAAWSTVLKPRGVIMGHDYTEEGMAKEYNFGVVQAVNEFCQRENWRIKYLTKEDYPSFLLEKL